MITDEVARALDACRSHIEHLRRDGDDPVGFMYSVNRPLAETTVDVPEESLALLRLSSGIDEYLRDRVFSHSVALEFGEDEWVEILGLTGTELSASS